MLRRLIIAIALTLAPAVCLADAASDLGPATSNPSGTIQSTDSTILQSGSSQSLQATPDAQSQSLGASNLNTLQTGADKLAVSKYLEGETDNTPVDPNAIDTTSLVALASLAAMLVLYALYYLVTVRRVKRHYAPHHRY